jgi:hypothetical protein
VIQNKRAGRDGLLMGENFGMAGGYKFLPDAEI